MFCVVLISDLGQFKKKSKNAFYFFFFSEKCISLAFFSPACL